MLSIVRSLSKLSNVTVWTYNWSIVTIGLSNGELGACKVRLVFQCVLFSIKYGTSAQRVRAGQVRLKLWEHTHTYIFTHAWLGIRVIEVCKPSARIITGSHSYVWETRLVRIHYYLSVMTHHTAVSNTCPCHANTLTLWNMASTQAKPGLDWDWKTAFETQTGPQPCITVFYSRKDAFLNT